MKRLLTAIALCLLTLGSVQNGFSQQRAGSLRGQVLDELGGAIVGAGVTAIDAAGKEKSVVTNDSGAYTISGLAPGKYTLRVINAGFAMFESGDRGTASNSFSR
jgi:uncharacterized protein (DUF2141 family)